MSKPRQQPSADWHLLFGLLALQNGLVSREQLVAAFAKWTRDKSVALEAILVEDGAIDEQGCQLLRQVVELHVQRHEDDPHKSLLSLSGSDLPGVALELEAIDDADLNESIVTVVGGESAASVPPRLGKATSASGRFRILKPLPGARGGMGEISIAQDEELGRQVALKQILSDKADRAAYRQKFQVEAEITGNLEHPGIVPIYGLGMRPDGRPYYAMRLVHGDNLAAQIQQFHGKDVDGLPGAKPRQVDYSSVEFHGLIDRLIDVAQAIRYAHSRGVLHRDLKPGNVLVGKYGETLVIDWGLARLPNLDEQPPQGPSSESEAESLPPLNIRSGSNVDATMQGQILGTVGYAPPEQLNGRVDLITERSDVYALGAILYQILVGCPPVTTKGKRQLDEVIQDTIDGKIVPPKRERRAVPKSLAGVCMKALACEPQDRYENVEELIGELENWKADQPVAAVPDSIADRVLRLARRYRAAALASAAALVGILIVAAIALVVVNRARVNETEARSEAETLAKRNQTVVDAFVAAFRSPDPENEGVTSQMTALNVLEQAREEVKANRDLNEDWQTKATLLDALGASLFSLGRYAEAVSVAEETRRLRETQLGPEHPETLTSAVNVAQMYQSIGRLSEALSLYEEALRVRKASLGIKHPDTVTSMMLLALGYAETGKLSEALSLYEEALQFQKANLGAEHPDTLVTMSNLAVGYKLAGRLQEALRFYMETLRILKDKLGDDHPKTLTAMNNLATGYRGVGRLEEALQLHQETLRLRRGKLGNDHPDTLQSMHNLAIAYEDAWRLKDALLLHEETLRRQRRTLGNDHPTTLTYLNSLAIGYMQDGRPKDALPLLEETLHLLREKLGDDHPNTLVTMNNVAGAYEALGRWKEALLLHDETLRLQREKLGADHPNTLNSMSNLATLNCSLGRLDSALALYEELLPLRRGKLGHEHPATLSTAIGWRDALLEAGNHAKAQRLADELMRILEGMDGPDQRQFAKAATSLAEALFGLENYTGARERIKEALSIEEIDPVERLRAHSIQGGILAMATEWEPAEKLLVDSAQELTKQLADIAPQSRWYVPRAHERLIAMYEAWGKPEKVEEWKAKLAKVNVEIERLRNGGMPPDDEESETESHPDSSAGPQD